jgi:plasminogen activator inhibitor 1 RNA-binding protein
MSNPFALLGDSDDDSDDGSAAAPAPTPAPAPKTSSKKKPTAARGSAANPGRPQKREFDRKSAKGGKSGESRKSGAGKGNWGSVQDDVESMTEPVEPQSPAAGTRNGGGEGGAPTQGGEAPEQAAVVAEEEESEESEEEFDLAEYNAMLKEKRANLPNLAPKAKPRQVQAFDGLVLKKEEVEEVTRGKNKKKGGQNKKAAPTDINAFIGKSGVPRGSSGGGRGGGRGGEGRGRGRGRGEGRGRGRGRGGEYRGRGGGRRWRVARRTWRWRTRRWRTRRWRTRRWRTRRLAGKWQGEQQLLGH